MPLPTYTQLAEAITAFFATNDKAYDIVNGPASGAGSTVEVESGTLDTFAKIQARLPAPLQLTAIPVDGVTVATAVGQQAIVTIDGVVTIYVATKLLPTAWEIVTDTAVTIADKISEDPEVVISSLNPTRLLYLDDIPSSFFNGSHAQTISAIPLTAEQAIVGTKIRLRGFVKIGFQGTFPEFGGDCFFALVINSFTAGATPLEGLMLVVTKGSSAMLNVDMELELKAAGTGKFKVGVSSVSAFNAHGTFADTLTNAIDRWWNVSNGSMYEVDPTVPDSVGNLLGLTIKLQASGGSTNLSLCNFWMDLNYEITVP